jgi:hypothetical protein
MGAGRLLTTLYWPKRPAWMAYGDVVDRDAVATSALLARLARAPGRYEVVALDGASGGRARVADLGAATLLARRSWGPAVVITDATWGYKGLLDRVACRAALRAFDSDRVVYCVLSREERRLFPRTWGIPADRVEFTPFYYTGSEEELDAPTREDGGVFAGGDTLRDYGTLVAAARVIPGEFHLATRQLEGVRGLPPNVRVGPVPHPRFMDLMRAAAVVVVPLARTRERSAGQQTYLNAMAMGKLVIVPDVMGVRDYVEHGRTGLIVPAGDAAALGSALRRALDPARRAEARAIGARAREVVRGRFGPDQYAARMMEVVRHAAARARPLDAAPVRRALRSG